MTRELQPRTITVRPRWVWNEPFEQIEILDTVIVKYFGSNKRGWSVYPKHGLETFPTEAEAIARCEEILDEYLKSLEA